LGSTSPFASSSTLFIFHILYVSLFSGIEKTPDPISFHEVRLNQKVVAYCSLDPTGRSASLKFLNTHRESFISTQSLHSLPLALKVNVARAVAVFEDKIFVYNERPEQIVEFSLLVDSSEHLLFVTSDPIYFYF
jgi:hypothetical protein